MSQEEECQERLSSVVLSEHSNDSIISDTDIEAQIDISQQDKDKDKDKEILKIISQNKTQIKSILKIQPSVEENMMLEKKIIVCCIWMITLILYLPIIICDVYFAYNDNTCINKYSSDINVNLKQYLIVSALTTFVMINAYMLITNYSINNEYSKSVCFLFSTCVFMSLLRLFVLVWNILGAFIFWGSIYGKGYCSKHLTTYLFVSLIIKFALSAYSYKNSIKSCKE